MKLSSKQLKVIEINSKKRAAAEASILISMNEKLVPLFSAEAKELIDKSNKKMGKEHISKISQEKVSKKITSDYADTMIKRKGSMCVERVVEKLPSGEFKVYTRQKFVPWLANMTDDHVKSISKIIDESVDSGVAPKKFAKTLDTYFTGTNHRSIVAARTESAKIRQDTLFSNYVENGTEYCEYVTAGDDRVRISHAMLSGRIFKLKEAPEVGNFSCRCLLVPADVPVSNGAKVEKSQVVTIPAGTKLSDI